MRRPLIAGNWKMNGSLDSVRALAKGLTEGLSDAVKADVAVCPPALYIPEVTSLLKDSKIAVGGQDVSNADSGAYTGEIAAPMLNDFGCKYAIVGHSERRHGRGESDQLCAEKFKAVQDAGLTPIFCIGELEEERDQGITEEVCARQIDAVLDLCGVQSFANAVIAYEPVWAIGTGKTATPEQAQEVHAFVRGHIAKQDASVAENLIIQYGGSMNDKNAAELLSQPDIDGGLIGGASLKADSFLAIVNAAG